MDTEVKADQSQKKTAFIVESVASAMSPRSREAGDTDPVKFEGEAIDEENLRMHEDKAMVLTGEGNALKDLSTLDGGPISGHIQKHEPEAQTARETLVDVLADETGTAAHSNVNVDPKDVHTTAGKRKREVDYPRLDDISHGIGVEDDDSADEDDSVAEDDDRAEDDDSAEDDDNAGDDDSTEDYDSSLEITVVQSKSLGIGSGDEIQEVTIIENKQVKTKSENAKESRKEEPEIIDCDEITVVHQTKAEGRVKDIPLKREDNIVKVEHGYVIGPTDEKFADDEQLSELRSKVKHQRELVRDFNRLLNEASTELNSLENQLTVRVTQLKRAVDAAFDWNANTFPWNAILAQELKEVFKIRSFRPLQRESLNATLMKRDVFAILPTGAGKSLIYQLAAVVDRGLTVVVTPLISLSLDQQRALRALNIRAESLDSTTNKGAVNRIYREFLPKNGSIARSKEPRKKRRRVEKKVNVKANRGKWVQDDMEPSILFVTPEQLVRNKKLMSRIETMYEAGHFTRAVIDEAHCCSSWGHDFRADYRKLGVLKRQCPETPLVALSATCCPETTSDVCKTLEIPDCAVFRGSIDRCNLFYEVRPKKDDEEAVIVDIASMLLNEFEGQCGIVYVLSRKEAATYSESLNALGIRAGCYHGDMMRQERNAVHEGWQNGDLQVAVATIAFGLGIDNQRVRFVIHATMATSLEGYYQESGRAGRNGKPAKCVLLHRAKDFARLSAFVAERGGGRIRKLYDMYRYASGRGIDDNRKGVSRCRRAIIAASFGESPPARNDCDRAMCCDICAASGDEAMVLTDVTGLAKSSLRIMIHMGWKYPTEKVTLLNLATNWSNKGVKGKRFRGDEPALDRRISLAIRLEILIGLIFEEALEEYYRHSSYAVNSYVSAGQNVGDFLDDSTRFEVVLRKADAVTLSSIMGQSL